MTNIRRSRLVLYAASLAALATAMPARALEYDSRIGLGVQPDGTPVLELAQGAHVIHWDPTHADASDAHTGTDRARPKATVAAAWSALRSGKGDWLAMACGTHDTALGVLAPRNGRSAAYPIVATGYDRATGELRHCRVRFAGQSPHLLMLMNGQRFVVFEHIEIDPGPKNDGVVMLLGGGARDTLFFDFHVRRAHWSIQSPDAPLTGITIRRSSMAYAYKASGHHQGLYLQGVHGATIEDSVQYHNGWQTDRNEATDDPARKPNVFKHNSYFSTSTRNIVYRRNLNGHASSHGIQARGGGVLVDNVFRANPLNVLIGGGDNHNVLRPDGVTYTVRGNVIDGAADIDAANRRGHGLDFINTARGSATDNIVANVGPLSTGNQSPLTWSVQLAGTRTTVDARDNIFHAWPGPTPILAAAGLVATMKDNMWPNGDVAGNLREPATPFPDPGRTVATWAAAQGFANEAAMWDAAIANPMRNWASEIRAYVRAGFGR